MRWVWFERARFQRLTRLCRSGRLSGSSPLDTNKFLFVCACGLLAACVAVCLVKKALARTRSHTLTQKNAGHPAAAAPALQQHGHARLDHDQLLRQLVWRLVGTAMGVGRRQRAGWLGRKPLRRHRPGRAPNETAPDGALAQRRGRCAGTRANRARHHFTQSEYCLLGAWLCRVLFLVHDGEFTRNA